MFSLIILRYDLKILKFFKLFKPFTKLFSIFHSFIWTNNFKYFCGNKIKYRFSLFNLIRIKTSFLFFIKLYRCEHFVFAKFYRKEVNSTKEKNAKKMSLCLLELVLLINLALADLQPSHNYSINIILWDCPKIKKNIFDKEVLLWVMP